MEQVCLVCREPNSSVLVQEDFFLAKVNCAYCGKYSITEDAIYEIGQNPIMKTREIANARGWMRENKDIKLGVDEIEVLRTLKTPSVAERAEKIFVAMNGYKPSIGAIIEIGKQEHLSKGWVAYSWSTNVEELKYLLRDYLSNTKGWLIDLTAQGEFMSFKIAPKGHDFLEEIRTGAYDRVSGFCAMWFSSDVSTLWTDAISPAIERAGYHSVRIDSVQHNNKIDDEILANIRSSRFVVADFTGGRGGVYFEAGFALGLGLPVIWTVREDSLPEIHFDNRQYNFILWKPEDLPDFAKRLQLRIEATIGKGPVLDG